MSWKESWRELATSVIDQDSKVQTHCHVSNTLKLILKTRIYQYSLPFQGLLPINSFQIATLECKEPKHIRGSNNWSEIASSLKYKFLRLNIYWQYIFYQQQSLKFLYPHFLFKLFVSIYIFTVLNFKSVARQFSSFCKMFNNIGCLF